MHVEFTYRTFASLSICSNYYCHAFSTCIFASFIPCHRHRRLRRQSVTSPEDFNFYWVYIYSLFGEMLLYECCDRDKHVVALSFVAKCMLSVCGAGCCVSFTRYGRNYIWCHTHTHTFKYHVECYIHFVEIFRNGGQTMNFELWQLDENASTSTFSILLRHMDATKWCGWDKMVPLTLATGKKKKKKREMNRTNQRCDDERRCTED